MATYVQLEVDDFQRVDENPLTATKWTQVSGGPHPIQLKSHLAIGTSVGGLGNSMYYSGAILPNNQYVEGTIGAIVIGGGGGGLSLFTRASIDNLHGYQFSVSGAGGGQLAFQTSGSSILSSVFPFTPQVGDVFRIECLLSRISFLYNGVVLYTTTNTDNVSGVASIFVQPTTSVTDTAFSHFDAGSITGTLCPTPPLPNGMDIFQVNGSLLCSTCSDTATPLVVRSDYAIWHPNLCRFLSKSETTAITNATNIEGLF